MRDLERFQKLGKKILGAGLNYKSLAIETKQTIPKAPILFLKPTSTYITEGQDIVIPSGYEVNYEVELGVIIGKTCKNVKIDQVDEHIAGYCVALDLTATNLIKDARAQGLPWTIGKAFDTATPTSSVIEKKLIPCTDNLRLWCSVNDQMKQDNVTTDMVFPIRDLVAYASKRMTLEPYDLILTGSPAGVGPLHVGDTIKAGVGDQMSVCFNVIKGQ